MMENFLQFISKIPTSSPNTQNSLKTINTALDTHTIHNVWFSLNAGKDNMVCFYLLCIVLQSRKLSKQDLWPNPNKFPINFIYFQEKQAFQENIDFMENLEKMLDLNVVYYPNPENLNRHKVMVNGLQHIKDKYNMKSIILGIFIHFIL